MQLYDNLISSVDFLKDALIHFNFSVVTALKMAAGALGLVWAPTAILNWIGFGAIGVKAGSFAAWIHHIIGIVAPGSILSIFQSIGAAGLAMVPQAVLGTVGAIIGFFSFHFISLYLKTLLI